MRCGYIGYLYLIT
ncbi:hypothetical protein VCHENC02_3992A, partial [Vibrio harveyi]